MELNKKWGFCICDFETTGIDKSSLPIEVGCIFTDHNFRTIKTYESLVWWNQFIDRDHWNGKEMPAYKVHNIELKDVESYGQKPVLVSADIYNITHDVKKANRFDRIILISDNAKFETRHMEILFNENTNLSWPFHYTTWDTSLMLEAVGVGDPIPIHRALPDAALLQVAIIQAMDRARNLK